MYNCSKYIYHLTCYSCKDHESAFWESEHLSNKVKLEKIHYSESNKNHFHGLKHQTGALELSKIGIKLIQSQTISDNIENHIEKKISYDTSFWQFRGRDVCWRLFKKGAKPCEFKDTNRFQIEKSRVFKKE